MERVIKFRGQCKISKEMVFGDLIHGVSYEEGQLFILPHRQNLAYVKHCDPLNGVRVISETVGQFTGLFDKHGKEIYDGDIVMLGGIPVLVFWNNGSFHVALNPEQGANNFIKERSCKSEIIGSIHTNPESINQK